MSHPPQETPGWYEFLDVRAEYETSRRRILVGVFGTPAIAALWASTCSQARRIDAGQLSPHQILDDARRLELIWDPIWLTAYTTIGTRGLHVAFGLLVAAATVAGVFGWARVRALERRYGSEPFREADLAEFVQSRPELAEKVEAAKSEPRPVVRPTGTVRIVPVIFRLVPIAALIVTIAFVWMALKP